MAGLLGSTLIPYSFSGTCRQNPGEVLILPSLILKKETVWGAKDSGVSNPVMKYLILKITA